MKYYEPMDVSIPAFGLGTWKSAKGEVYEAVKQALRLGYRHIDCAPAYSNEKEVGEALREMQDNKTVQRSELWVTSKLWNNAHKPEDVEGALRKTLADLCLDYLDLYLIHWPVAFRPEVFFPKSGADYLSLEEVPIIGTWQALEECVTKGLTRKIGVCNFSTKKLNDLLAGASVPPMMNQIELHPFLQQQDMLTFCRKNNILLTAYSPLGSTDRPKGMKKRDEPSLLTNEVIGGIAQKHGATPAQVLISWALERETVVIPKSVNAKRLEENLAALELHLDIEDMTAIAQLDMGYRLVDGAFFAAPGSGYTVSGIWDE